MNDRADFRVASWNINGARAAAKKGLMRSLATLKADVVGVQEVRALVEQLPPGVRAPKSWKTAFAAAERKGYSGVGLFSRRTPDEITTSLSEERFDCEGRVQVARFGELTIVNVYFPNGSGKQRDNGRVPYKLDFYRALFDRVAPLVEGGKPVLVIGDFNTAHQEIDLARPKSNSKTSGFLVEEREVLSRLLDAGWVDTFRHHCSEPDHYSWWSNRPGVREKNVGWRIDYIFASPGAMPFFRSAAIHPKIMGSDHCPVSVTLDPAITGD